MGDDLEGGNPGGHDTKATRQASRDVLKSLYAILFGLAIREALNRGFLAKNANQELEFLGLEIFTERHLSAFLLCCAFLFTAIRFVHGASIHIHAVPSPKAKPVVDFVGFLIQGAILYLMAVTVHMPTSFGWLFVILLIIDLAWLSILHYSGHHKITGTERQWIWSNVIMLIMILLVVFCSRASVSSIGSAVIAVSSILAAICDYYSNRSFYFGKRMAFDVEIGDS